MKQIPQWKNKLLGHIYTRYSTCLLTTIRQSQPLLIATDGSKSDSQCGGSYVISTLNRKLLAQRYNPDLEAYAILSVLLFLHEYSKNFSLQIINKITIYRDNKEIVTKVKNIRSNAKYYDLNYNMSEHEVMIAIKMYLPTQY